MVSLRRLAAPLLLFALCHPLLASAADPSCACEDGSNAGDGAAEEQVVRILTLGTDPNGEFAFMGIERTAAEYHDDTGVRIQLDWINDESLRVAELQGQLQSELPLYDGFVIPSHLVGSAAQFDGFMDLTEIVRARPELEWSDIYLGFRDNVSNHFSVAISRLAAMRCNSLNFFFIKMFAPSIFLRSQSTTSGFICFH